METEFYLGANTARGFVSHYDQLFPGRKKRLVRIIKGGAGCGKSTLMKKVAMQAEQIGLDVERICCSSDPDSLDGVAVPQVGYALVDGTAPHVVEPMLCGSREIYLDLSGGYDVDGLRGSYGTLIELARAGQACYPRATACLNAVASLEPLLASVPPVLTPELAISICEREIGKRDGTGMYRTVFLSSYTPAGRQTCWKTIDRLCGKVYVLRDSAEAITTFLRAAAQIVTSRGWNCIIGDSPLVPGVYWEHLLVPEQDIAFVTSMPLSPYPGQPARILGRQVGDEGILNMQKVLTAEATEHLRQAKEFHDLLETTYAPFVDFSLADCAAQACCAELVRMAEQTE